MIVTNSALYLGIVIACIQDRVPVATVLTERTDGGYKITAMIKVGDGADARSFVSGHEFTDAQTAVTGSGDLTDAARVAGNTLASDLEFAK